MLRRRQIAAALAALCLLAASPARAQYVPAVPGQSCTQNGNLSNTNGFLVCSGGVWVASPVYIGTQLASCSSTYTGMARYNTTTNKMEYCNGSAWSPFSSGSSYTGTCTGSAGTDTSLANGLVYYWNFDQGSGSSVYDFAGSNNIGTWQGTLGSQWTTGKINGGGLFDGTDNYISTANAYTEVGTFSVAAWFKTTTASGHKIVGFENTPYLGGAPIYDHHLYIGSDGKLYFGVCGSAGCPSTVNSSGTVTNGVWHFAVGTETGSVMALYLDGALAGSISNTPSNLTTGWWHIGNYTLGSWPNATSGYYTGSIDEVSIWSIALTQAQVTTLYNGGTGNAYGAPYCPSTTGAGGFAN